MSSHGPTSLPPASAAVIVLSPFRADVTRALLRRGNKLLESSDMAAQMQALSPLEAYYTCKELGLEAAVPLLRHATREQIQACIDLDCWQGDSLKVAEVDAWLAPFAAESEEALAAAFFALDDEVQTLFLAQLVSVRDVREEGADADSDAGDACMPTPDGLFLLEARRLQGGVCMDDAEGDEDGTWELEVEPFVLVRALYKADDQEAMRLLMAAKWELLSCLQEQAFTFRNARLQDLGFNGRAEAMRIFAPPPAGTPPPSVAAPVGPLPALYASALHDDSLLVRALGEVSDPAELQRLEAELICLVNDVVVAADEGPRSMGRVVEVAAQVRDTLSLGLLHLQGATAVDQAACAQAAAALGARPLRHIFAHGYQQVLALRRAALKLCADPVVAHFMAQQGEPDSTDQADRRFVRGLCRVLPLLLGDDRLQRQTPRACGAPHDIEAARARLEALAARLR